MSMWLWAFLIVSGGLFAAKTLDISTLFYNECLETVY